MLFFLKWCKGPPSDTDSTLRKRGTFGNNSMGMDRGSSEDSFSHNNFSIKFEKKSTKRKRTIEEINANVHIKSINESNLA